MKPQDGYRESEAWRKGLADATTALAAQRDAVRASTGCPVSYGDGREGVSRLTYSLVASPRLLEWPPEVRRWLYDRLIVPARKEGERDEPMHSLASLGLGDGRMRADGRGLA